jgi:hypothetical protein
MVGGCRPVKPQNSRSRKAGLAYEPHHARPRSGSERIKMMGKPLTQGLEFCPAFPFSGLAGGVPPEVQVPKIVNA